MEWQIIAFIIFIIKALTYIYVWIIIISAILSWFRLSRDNIFAVLIDKATSPIYRLIRRYMPSTIMGQIDITPIIAIIGLNLLSFIIIKIILFIVVK